jgi:hypothetical protein
MESHGLDYRDCRHASIEIGYQQGNGPNVCAWLDVEFVKRNGEGKPYAVRGPHGSEIATGHALLPLHSWPKLTEVVQNRDQ